jgi:hypothetical protein
VRATRFADERRTAGEASAAASITSASIEASFLLIKSTLGQRRVRRRRKFTRTLTLQDCQDRLDKLARGYAFVHFKST